MKFSSEKTKDFDFIHDVKIACSFGFLIACSRLRFSKDIYPNRLLLGQPIGNLWLGSWLFLQDKQYYRSLRSSIKIPTKVLRASAPPTRCLYLFCSEDEGCYFRRTVRRIEDYCCTGGWAGFWWSMMRSWGTEQLCGWPDFTMSYLRNPIVPKTIDSIGITDSDAALSCRVRWSSQPCA
jgi:hypothetical protein